MKVAVKLHGILRDYRPSGVKVDTFDVELGAPAVVRQTVEHFGIPTQKVHAVFVNDEPADLTTPLKDGDHVRLFPPVVGGTDRPYRVFIAGIMQGSLRGNTIGAQNYRREISAWLTAHVPGIEIVDPYELHPESVNYDDNRARQTLIDLAKEAGRADCVIAFVPEASMGTALEMYEAYANGRPVFTISPLTHNWVVKGLSARVFADLSEFQAFVVSGEFERLLRSLIEQRLSA